MSNKIKDNFTLTDTFNLNEETIIKYGNDAANRQAEMYGYKLIAVNLISKQIQSNNEVKYLFEMEYEE